MMQIATACRRYQNEMLRFGADNRRVTSVDTLRDLANAYQTDPQSRFHKTRYSTQQSYLHDLKILSREYGDKPLAELRGRDFIVMHEAFKAPVTKTDKDGNVTVGPERIRRAHGLMTMLRIITSFGAGILEHKECQRMLMVLDEMEFESPAARTQQLSAEQAQAIIDKALALKLPSIALAQALQFELTLRQKDIIGEWVPLSSPGLSLVSDRKHKWMVGLRWEEVDEKNVLRHATSKTGAALVFDLAEYPMVKALLPIERGSGPMIISEATGQPYKKRHFAAAWRKVATAAGIPKDVWNMDSRSGGITEATDADPSKETLEAARHQAGHSDIATTQRYSRRTLQKVTKVARLRVAARNKVAE